MQRSRRVIAASVSVSMALATGAAVAHADDSSTLYVNNAASANCTDTASGAGSAATPFCTIQAAANAATAGDTVEIAKGTYAGALDITSSGTAQAPIVFQPNGRVIIADASGQTAPAVTFDGASYVDFEGAEGVGSALAQQIEINAVLVSGSSHIGLDSIASTSMGATPATGIDAVHVTGTSSDVTITRSFLEGVLGGVLVDAGSSGDVISTNKITANSFGISVDGASNTAITSNTVITRNPSDEQIGVFSGSTGTSIEDNIVGDPSIKTVSDPAAVMVDASSAANTTADYNVVWPGPDFTNSSVESAYSWAGTDYTSSTTLAAATGQGEHDVTAYPGLSNSLTATYATAPQIDSANSAAPGVLSTDMYGAPCSVDPVIPISGAGTPAYCERGAVQQTFTTSVGAAATAVGGLSASLNSSMSQSSRDPISQVPTPAVSYIVDWGDGTTSAPLHGSSTSITTNTTHTYAKAGTYTITDTAELTDGSTTSTTVSFTTTGSDYSAVNPARVLDTRHGVGGPTAKVPVGGSITVSVAGVASIPANATAVALNLTATDTTGDGFLSVDSASTSSVNYVAGQTVANSVIAPITNGSITIYNQGTAGSADIVADVSGYFSQTPGDGYSAAPLARILNTRTGTGAPEAKVSANSGIPVTIAGVDSIPAGVAAVALHVTVADTTGSGWIAAEPDGAGVPTTSSLNYANGQIVSNTVIVPVAPDGKIELYNGGGTTPVDLLADVSGYFSTTAPDAYIPVSPARVWDSRQVSGGTIPSAATYPALLDGDNGDVQTSPYPADATLITNATVTDAKGSGYLTVYPADANLPAISTLNFNAGQTLAGLGFVATSGPDQAVDVYNESTGSIDVVFDVFGYFSAN